jgi:hypothetical protein
VFTSTPPAIDGDGSEEVEFAGPDDGGWYRTQIPDWIALHPDLRDSSYRLYCILRALILEKQPQKIRLLTLDQIAFLMVGKNGKPVGATTVKDALRNLHDVGLVDNPDGARVVSSAGKGSIQSRRRYRLNDWPNKKRYEGWRNAFAKLDAYTANWRTTRTDVCPGQIDGRKTGPRSDPNQNGVSPGQFDGRISVHGGRKSVHGGRKSVEIDPLTSGNTDSLKEFPEGVSSSSSGTTATPPAPRPPEDDEDTSPTTTPRPRVADVVASRTGATPEEAAAVVDRIRDHAARSGRTIASLSRYVGAIPVEDLEEHLAAVRRRVPQQGPGGPAARVLCDLHRERTVPCTLCIVEARDPDSHRNLRRTLEVQGPEARPDLVALLGPPAAADQAVPA